MTLILSGTNGLSDVDGSAATPAIRGTDANTGIFFPAADTIAFAEGGAEVARFDSSGNLGIGTSSPSTYGSTQKILAVQAPSGTVAGYIATVSSDATRSVGMYSGLSSSDTPSLIYVNALRFGSSTTTDGVTGYSEKMRIDSSGNLLVGATSTNYGEQLKITFPNTQGIHLNESTNSSSVNYQYFTKGSTPTNVGAIFYNGSVMAYQTTSDYRLKENIAPMTGALAKIAALKPVTYTWKDNQRSGEGFIAHELQENFPDAVSGIKDDVDEDGNPKYQGMDASILIATLTAAIQEQQALITDLTARITALEAK
jgi:hypothetical protein